MNRVLIFGLVVLALLVGTIIGMLIANRPLTGPFIDTEGHPYEWAIEEIRLAGLTAGCGNDQFCPDRPLTRGEAAVMLARMLP